MRRPTFADLLVLLAVAALVAALVRPSWQARERRARVELAVRDVQAVAVAARRALGEDGRWPEERPAGTAPPELVAAGVDRDAFERAGYTLAWTRWQIVDSVLVERSEPLPTLDVSLSALEPVTSTQQPVAVSVGAVALRTSEEWLLAELRERFAAERPVVIDDMLLLVLPERSGAPPAG